MAVGSGRVSTVAQQQSTHFHSARGDRENMISSDNTLFSSTCMHCKANSTVLSLFVNTCSYIVHCTCISRSKFGSTLVKGEI